MADSEELRLRRIKEHEQRMSRIFDEVMGLGDFADSSRGSASSSKSGQDETKVRKDNQQPGEEESNCSRQEEKIDKSFPCITSLCSNPPSSFTLGTSTGSGGAALDNAMDAIPLCGVEDDDDWNFDLPSKSSQLKEGKFETQRDTFAGDSREAEEDDNNSTSSATTLHSSQDHTPENSRDGVLNQSDETEDSQQEEPAPPPVANRPLLPNVNIKDEPIDEEYDAALLPQSSIKQIKEELEHQEEELRISSVYSVGGGNAFAHPFVPAAVPAPVQAPAPATIFIPGRGTVLQAMAPLHLRLPAPVPSTLPVFTPTAPRPPLPSIPGGVRCSGCAKVLLKGQTAFQRKGSTQLFCSTVCLTGHLPSVTKNRSCFQCNKEILQPRDMVTVPTENNTYMNFCGQFCLSVFRHKKKLSQNIAEKWADKRGEKKQDRLPEKTVDRHPDKQSCSVCQVTGKIEHEVNHQGSLHKLCSDVCFVTWRKMRQLALNCCEGCGLYCNSNSGSCQTLKVEKSELNFCGPTCISTYKQTCRKTTECAYCRKVAVVSSTIMERDQRGKVQLYCSPLCVEKSRPPKHTLSDTAFPCSHCKVSAVPQYHLAMVDGTIRNFCSYNCVTTFRKSSNLSDITNGTSSSNEPPIKDASKSASSTGSSSVPQEPSSVQNHHSSNSTDGPLAPHNSEMPTAPGQAPPKTDVSISRLSCYFCKRQFRSKPQILSHQGSISVFCSNACCLQYKMQKNIVASCQFCKKEKVLYETITNNQDDLTFCSENCKLLFKQNCANHPWHPCSYCSSFCQKMLHSHYGGKMEEFCKAYCMSQYTVLYYGMARCDSCRKQGYMTENLQCMGSVRNFCNLPCLLHYCYMHFESNKHSTSNGTCPESPKPHEKPAKCGKNAKNHDHASTQTDAMHVPLPRRRPMKNKTVLCRPFTVDQEVSCQLLRPESAAPLDSQQPSKSTFEAATSPPASPNTQVDSQSCSVPARLSGRHFLGKREANTDCKVCSEYKRKRAEEETEARKRLKLEEKVNEENLDDDNGEEEEEEAHTDVTKLKRQTTYYCKTCPGEPSLCPVPCFELYHTRLIYKTAHELDMQGVLPVPSSLAGEDKVKVLMVPVPVPVFIPVPMNMYSQHTPVPMAMPLPVPVPVVVPPQKKEMKDAAVQLEAIAARGEMTDEAPNFSTDEKSKCDQTESHSSQVSPVTHGIDEPESAVNQAEESTTTRHLPFTSAELEPPSSPVMDFENDFPSEVLGQKAVAAQRGVKRARESPSRKRARRRTGSAGRSKIVSASTKLNHLYGVNAWKSWVRQCNKQQPSDNPLNIEEDILRCDSYQLSLALCRFIREVRRPNGESYSPDSTFYLCLGIQQYLFMKGRIENIFTDQLYSHFASDIAEMLKQWKPTPPLTGSVISSRVEESFLWECKQLGGYSPIVLLNTLLFVITKNLSFVTVEQHESLSFANIALCTKHCSKAGRVSYLLFKRSSMTNQGEKERLGKRQREEKENMELLENVSNPLHCPVRLYEFYLSKCPETVRKRTDFFFLQPEQNVHTHSSYWYTCQPLEKTTLQNMLTRILAVREVQEASQAKGSS